MKRNCENRKEEILEYLEGSRDDARTAELKAHLDRCDTCRATLAEYERSWEMLDHYPAPEASEDFVSRTLAAVQEDRAAGGRLWIRRTAVAVAAGLILAVALFFALKPAAPGEESAADDLAQVEQVEEELLENLDLLEDLEFLEEYGEDLELAMEYDLYELMLAEENL
jgi:anti-sigma factor RsiW